MPSDSLGVPFLACVGITLSLSRKVCQSLGLGLGFGSGFCFLRRPFDDEPRVLHLLTAGMGHSRYSSDT